MSTPFKKIEQETVRGRAEAEAHVIADKARKAIDRWWLEIRIVREKIREIADAPVPAFAS